MDIWNNEDPCFRCQIPPTLRVIKTIIYKDTIEHLAYICPQCGLTSGLCILEAEASFAWRNEPTKTYVPTTT